MVDFDQVTYVRSFFHLQGLVEVNLITIEQVKQVHNSGTAVCAVAFFFIETWWAEFFFFFSGLFLTVCWSDYPTDFEVAVWDHGRFSSLLQSLGSQHGHRDLKRKKTTAQDSSETPGEQSDFFWWGTGGWGAEGKKPWGASKEFPGLSADSFTAGFFMI